MARIGVTMKELDGELRPRHESLVDLRPNDHAAHRHDAIGDRLRERREVGLHAEIVGRKRLAQASESGYDFIEYQQDAVPRADFAQALEIAAWRHDDSRRTLHRLDD